jgi:hypothetical protein
LSEVAFVEQCKFLNRTRAVRRDDRILPDTPSKASSVSGSGRWKQLCPTEALRTIFADQTQTIRSLCSRIRSSGRYVVDLMFAGANLLRQREYSTVDDLLASSDFDFLGYQLVWDETKFRLLAKGDKGRGTDVSMMAAHSRLEWSLKSTADTVHKEEFLLPPAALVSTSAAAMWSGLRQTLPDKLFKLISGQDSGIEADVFCICTGTDHASSNVRLIAHMLGCLKSINHVWVLPGYCKQHASGLCLSPLTKKHGIASPGFCISKLLRNDKVFLRFMVGIRLAIRDRMQWVKVAQGI